MTTPFSSAFAPEILRELLAEPEKTTAGLAWSWVKQFDEEYDEIEENEAEGPIDEALSIRVWITGCLLDAVLNGTDYAADCEGFSDDYRMAVRAFDASLHRVKKRLFARPKPVYSIPKFVDEVYDALLVADDDDCTAFGKLQPTDESYAELACALGDLCERLEDHTPLHSGGIA